MIIDFPYRNYRQFNNKKKTNLFYKYVVIGLIYKKKKPVQQTFIPKKESVRTKRVHGKGVRKLG